nr:reverse transcriptase domain-containing protein [Tanacetum cinerariifolium]
MSTNKQTSLSLPTSAVRNTLGREQASQNLVRPVPDEDLREYCDKNYHQILPIIAKTLHQEKVQQEKLKTVKARLNFEKALQYSKSETPNRRRNLKERLGPRGARTRSISLEQRRGRSKSLREKGPKRRTVFKRLEKGVFHMWETRRRMFLHIQEAQNESHTTVCQKVKEVQEGTGSQNQRSKSQAWRMTYPNHGVWFDDLPKESIDSYDELRKAFLENYLEQKKCIKDPVEIYNIKQRNEESTEEFVRRYKLECRDVKGAPECMKIFGFIHGITNPELIKRLHDKIPKSMDEMMSTKAKLQKGNFQNEQRMERKQFRFTLVTKTPREILALDKGKFKPPPSMTTPVEKRNASKFYEFHGEVGHTTDECMHLKRQIEEMLKAGKLSHLIKELKQNHRKDQAKIAKKGETSRKDKPLAILMVQPWQKIARQRITQTFFPESLISFPALGEEDRTEGPMIIKAEMGGHCVHRIYMDGGSSLEILGEIIWPLGQISLLVRIGDEEHSTSAQINLMVVRSPSFYNGIIGRPGKLADMTRVPRHIAEHRLNVRERCLPVWQKKKGKPPERNKAISEVVKKLVEADIMKEVNYHSWLSNPVMNYHKQKKMHQRSGRNSQHQAEGLRRYKLECMDVKGAPECMKISGFMHGITNPELIKRLHDKIPKRRDLKKRLGSRRVRSMSGSPEPRRGHFESPRKKDSKRKTVFKRLEKGVFHMLGDNRKKKQNLLLKNIITKEHPHEGRKRCHKVKVAQEDIGSLNQRGKSRASRMICPNHGYVKKQTLSLPGSVTLIFQSRHTTEVKTQKIT